MNDHTAKSTDPTIVARTTTYSGNVARMVQVFSEEAFARYAEHCNQKIKNEKNENTGTCRRISFKVP
jgi:hypothetical protein